MPAYQRVKAAKTLTLQLQVTDDTGELIVVDDVATASYSITTRSGSAVGSHTDVSLVVADIIESAAVAWDVDSIGYNVVLPCDVSFFPDQAMTYLVDVTFVMTDTSIMSFQVEIKTYGPEYNSTHYCQRSDIEDIFGMSNINKWADIENKSDPACVSARIAWAIGMATNEVNDRLRGSAYDLPFQPVPDTIKQVAALLAGVMLHDSRGLEDSEDGTKDLMGGHRQRAEKILGEIRNGQRQLGGGLSQNRSSTNVPFSF